MSHNVNTFAIAFLQIMLRANMRILLIYTKKKKKVTIENPPLFTNVVTRFTVRNSLDKQVTSMLFEM